MRALAEQTYYELLETLPEVGEQEIERAYRIARATYTPSSIAVYSLFSTEECSAILRRIEEAYAVLSDVQMRREYDARLRLVRPLPEPAQPESSERPSERVPSTAKVPPPRAPTPIMERSSATLDLDAEAPADGSFDGVALRRIRVALGIELDEIASITKINQHHLKSIEANQYDTLPAPVYLRGFLRQIARCLALDPQRVADGYTARMREVGDGRK